MVADRASKAGVEIKVELPDDIPVLTADPTRFKQIVLNLLSNAVKFTPPEGRIVLSAARADDGGLRVQVADTGIGIPDTALPSIFEPFVQVENVQQRSHEGAGLGLTLVKSLTELHGGTVSAESVPGEGTVVTVTFPAERLAEPAA
ncbi:MAG: ATP-binding protein [Magnetovibrio sp.]|nr:ATP-binding protein [Magnetovibrio sp.]